MEHIVDGLVRNLIQMAISLDGSEISAGLIITVYVFFVFLCLFADYINAYYIDKKNNLNGKIRRHIDLKWGAFLFKKYDRTTKNVIAIETFVIELITLILFILAIVSMIVSFYVNDLVKTILIGINILFIYPFTWYVSSKQSKLEK